MKPHLRRGLLAKKRRQEAAEKRKMVKTARENLSENYILILDTDPGPVYIENAILSGEAVRVDGGYLVPKRAK